MLSLRAHRDESAALMAQHSTLGSACKEHEGNKNIFTKVLRVMIWIGAFGHPRNLSPLPSSSSSSSFPLFVPPPLPINNLSFTKVFTIPRADLKDCSLFLLCYTFNIKYLLFQNVTYQPLITTL